MVMNNHYVTIRCISNIVALFCDIYRPCKILKTTMKYLSSPSINTWPMRSALPTCSFTTHTSWSLQGLFATKSNVHIEPKSCS